MTVGLDQQSYFTSRTVSTGKVIVCRCGLCFMLRKSENWDCRNSTLDYRGNVDDICATKHIRDKHFCLNCIVNLMLSKLTAVCLVLADHKFPDFELSFSDVRIACLVSCGALVERPFVKRFTLCYRSVVLHVCPVCPVLSVLCNVRALWPND